MNPYAELVLDVVTLLAKPGLEAIKGEDISPEQLEAERQALILAQRRIQEEIARRELPP